MAAVGVAAVIAVLLVAVAVIRVDRTTAIAGASTTQRLVAFSGSGEGELAVAFTPGESGAVLWGSDLPDPGQDKVYEIWMIQDGTPVSGGCFRPQDGQVALSVDASLEGTDAMAVTAEPADCPSSPSSEPGLVGSSWPPPRSGLQRSRCAAESFRPLNPRLPKP